MAWQTNGATLSVGEERAGANRLTCSLVLGIVMLAAAGRVPTRVHRHTNPASGVTQADTEKDVQTSPTEAIQALREEEDELATRLLKDFPEDSNALMFVGFIRRQQGNTAEARKYWERSLAHDPDRAEVHDQLGWLAMRRGDYSEAAARWRRALEIDPKLWGVYSALGRALMAMGRLDEARSTLEQGVQLWPSDTTSRFLLGQVCLQLRDNTNARRHYEAAIRSQPDLTNAYYGLAMACARLGDTDRAKECRQAFAELKRRDLAQLEAQNRLLDDLADAHRRVARSYANAGRLFFAARRARDAERLWRRAAELDPGDVGCRENLFALYRNTNRRREALDTCLELGKIRPTNPVYAINAASLSAELGRLGDAEAAYRHAIRLAPKMPLPYRNLAFLLLEMNKDPKEAKVLAEKAVRLQPTAPGYLALSSACHKCGDNSGALSAIRRAIDLEPQNEQYRRALQVLEKEQ